MGAFTRRGVSMGVLTMLLGAIGPVTASADTDLGSAGGFTYIQDQTTLPMGASTASAQADCPSGTKVVGGGAAVEAVPTHPR